MSVRTWLGAALTATAALLLLGGPALAVPAADVPDEVRAELDRAALSTAPGLAGDGEPADVSAESVHEVYRFTADFLQGRRVDVAVAPSGEWLAVLQRGEAVLGTVRVAERDGAGAELSGSDEDVELGTALTGLAEGELVVEDSSSGALFGLAGETVRPLNTWARLELTRPAELPDLQSLLASQTAPDRAGPSLSREQWLRLAGLAGFGTLFLALATVLVIRPRRGVGRPPRR
jgi:hypothetical protein